MYIRSTNSVYLQMNSPKSGLCTAYHPCLLHDLPLRLETLLSKPEIRNIKDVFYSLRFHWGIVDANVLLPQQVVVVVLPILANLIGASIARYGSPHDHSFWIWLMNRSSFYVSRISCFVGTLPMKSSDQFVIDSYK